MKILHIALMMIFGSSLVAMSNHAFADNTNGVEILNIHTQPSTIKVGDKFVVIATLVNNSTIPIFVERGACVGPLFIAFDSHVTTDDKKVTCTLQIISQKLNPGHKIVGTSSNHSYLTYRATASGTTNATVSFSYFVMSQTDLNQSRAEPTISKSFLFTISDNKSNPMSIDYGGRHTTNLIDPPLKQFKSEISPKDVKCNPNLQLIFKSENGSPACVKPVSANKLIALGWAIEVYSHSTSVAPFDTLKMNVIGTDLSFNYTILGGQLENATANMQNQSLDLSLKTTGNGTLIVILPRGLIDSQIHGQDSPFIIVEDGREVKYKQTDSTIADRMLISMS